MRRKLAFILLIMMIANSLSITNTGMCEPGASPTYVFIRYVCASLTIDSSGVASCMGEIRLNNTTSSVTATLTLYKQSGTSWTSVKNWSGSSFSTTLLNISRTKTVEAGTYKAVFSGIVTGADGTTERFSVTSHIVTYP